MRALLLILLMAVAGCTSWVPPMAALATEAAAVVVFGRGVVDMVVSGASGRDCSIVRLDRGLTYCAPVDAGRGQPFCTRSLGVVDCWADPAAALRQAGVADTPPPTAAQLRYRDAPWPKSLTGT